MRSRRDDHHLGRAASARWSRSSARFGSRSDAQVCDAHISEEERGITGLTATPVGDDETRIPHPESFQLLGSCGHVREVPHVVITKAPVQGRGCCACLIGIEVAHVMIALTVRGFPCCALMIDFYPTRDLALRRLFWGGWRCWSLGDREPLWSHAEKQTPICQRAVRPHRRSDNSSYSSVGRFPHHQLRN